MKTFTATELNKSPQKVFAAAKEDGIVTIEHDRYEDNFFIVEGESVSLMAAYMLSHECDIALGMNDFAELREPFFILIGREASFHGQEES